MESEGEQILFHHQAPRHTHTRSPADRHTHISIKSSISRVFQLRYYVASVHRAAFCVCAVCVRYITPRGPSLHP